MTNAPEPYGRVYVLDCAISRKQYVGQTITPLRVRFAGHVKASNRPTRTQPISHAFRKYGPSAFTMHELEACDDQPSLDAAEVRWAHTLSTFAPHGYNLRAGNGPGSASPELRARMSQAMTPERRAALSQLWSGRRLTDEAYENARAALLRPMTLLSPSGESTLIEDTVLFASENGLQYSLLRQVFLGSRLSHRGWRLVPDVEVHDEPAIVDPGVYACRSCGREWSSPSFAQARQHVVSCVRLRRCRDAALAMGNITEEQYSKARRAQQQPRVQVRDRKSPDLAVRQVRSVVLLSPQGESVAVDGTMKDFAAAHGLQRSSLSHLVRGKVGVYRGWTVVHASRL